jgi:hypothetical protein
MKSLEVFWRLLAIIIRLKEDNMEYVELFKLQLDVKEEFQDIAYNSNIYSEYLKLNCYLNDTERSNERIVEIVKDDIQHLTEADKLEIGNIANELLNVVHQVETIENSIFQQYRVDGIVFLIGDMTIDSHGILVDGKSYLMVDLSSYRNGKDFYKPFSFIIHEYVHAIHYKLNKEMYFTHFKSRKENILKRLIVEGIATYVTKHYSSDKESVVFWLGYLSDSDVNKWAEFAEAQKLIIGNRLTNQMDYETYALLFSVCNQEDIWKGRLAYYYGFKIVESLSAEYTTLEILALPYSKWSVATDAYFEINL